MTFQDPFGTWSTQLVKLEVCNVSKHLMVVLMSFLFRFLGFGGGFKSFTKKVEYVGVAYAAVGDADVGYDGIGDAYTSKRVQIGVYGK